MSYFSKVSKYFTVNLPNDEIQSLFCVHTWITRHLSCLFLFFYEIDLIRFSTLVADSILLPFIALKHRFVSLERRKLPSALPW